MPQTKPLKCTVLGAVISALWLTHAIAATVTASGAAPLDAGETTARQLAIQDALHQAALSQGALIESTETIDNGHYQASSAITTQPLSGKVTMLHEYSEGGLYHVRLSVNTDPKFVTAPTGSTPTGTAKTAITQTGSKTCQRPPAHQLRRRLVTTYFTVAQPDEASDLADLATRLPQELADRLAHNPLFRVSHAGEVSVLPDPRLTEPTAGAHNVRLLGRQGDIQFVIAGRVISTAVTSRFLRTTLFESSNTSQQGMYYNGPLSGLTGGAIKYVPTERQFDTEIWIYDALTGSVIARERVATLARGTVTPTPPLPFASAGFWTTDYGKTVDKALNEAVMRISQTLMCIPFSAHVVEVEQGNRLYINAGRLDGLNVGDTLLVYQTHSPAGVRSVASNPQLGIPEMLIGEASIVHVQPELAIAKVKNGKPVSIGDIVRHIPK